MQSVGVVSASTGALVLWGIGWALLVAAVALILVGIAMERDGR